LLLFVGNLDDIRYININVYMQHLILDAT